MKWDPRYTLRAYQRRLCRAVIDCFDAGVDGQTILRILAVAATGAGKTIMAAAMMLERIKKHHARCLFLADRDELVEQAGDKVRECTGHFVDYEKAELTSQEDSPIVIGSIQSMAGSRLQRFAPDRFTDIICDEAHLSLAANWQRVLGHFPKARILGITATPARSDNKPLMGFYQHLAANISLWELVKSRALVPITVRTVSIHIDTGDVEIKSGDNERLGVAVEPYWERIVDAWMEHASNRKTLWFLPSCKSSERFAAYLRKRGVTALHVEGESKDRKQIIQRFKSWPSRAGAVQNLTNSLLLTTGFDCPDIGCVVNLSPDLTPTVYQQKVGRGTRLWCPHGCKLYCDHEDAKRDLLLLDFMWQFARLGKPIETMGPADLIAENKEQRKRIKAKIDAGGTLDLLEVDEAVTDEREQEMIKALKYSVRHGNRVYDGALVAAVCHMPGLMDYEPIADWECKAASERQLAWLAGKGVNPDSIKSRGHASAVMTALHGRIQEGLASVKQVCALAKAGYEQPYLFTFEKAGEELSRIKKPWPAKGSTNKR